MISDTDVRILVALSNIFESSLLTKDKYLHKLLCLYNLEIILSLCFTVTIVCWCVIVLLVSFEIKDYWTPTISEELFVDTSRGPKLRINVDFIMPAISCECKPCLLL